MEVVDCMQYGPNPLSVKEQVSRFGDEPSRVTDTSGILSKETF